MMINIPVNDGYVYESPDGGKTIYRRLPGSYMKELYHITPEVKAQIRWSKLKNAIILAETEPALNDAVSKVEMLYELLKDDEGT